ncbi:MAG: transporter substrate-binding domain-containing protein [Planctomycetota bacterium]|jgi:polar amino acid transport system substrate-binding protein
MRFLLCALVLLGACAEKDTRSTLDIVLERGELIIGTEPEFPPFESKNAQGEFVGFDMDMARELAKDLGVRLRIDEMAFTSLPTALENGKVDLIISGMTIRPERAKNRAFTDPYFLTGLCLLVNRKAGIAKADDVDGKRVVVKRGTTGEEAAREFFKKSDITVLDKESTCAMEVVNGRADAFLYDQLSVLRHHQEHPEATLALLEPLTKEPYAMAARLDDQKWVDRLNKFLRDIRADGRYGKLREKYLAGIPDGAK